MLMLDTVPKKLAQPTVVDQALTGDAFTLMFVPFKLAVVLLTLST